MPALKIKLPMSFTDNSLPGLRADGVLPASGALMLLEPGHPFNALAGVPATGAVLPNIAAEQADALLGAQVRASFSRHANFTAAAGTIERTSKGGLHAIVSQTAEISSVGATVVIPDVVKTHVLNNPTHTYYMSLWSRVTRKPTGTDIPAKFAGPGRYRMNLTHGVNNADSYPTVEATVVGRRMSAPRAADGASFHGIATNGWLSGNNPAAIGDFQMMAANFSNGITDNNATTNKHSSWVLYRYYLEDLTVSGRSYATVDAINYAEYQKHVLTAGGRYYGDSFTAPTTIP